jgi:hypothetical protein
MLEKKQDQTKSKSDDEEDTMMKVRIVMIGKEKEPRREGEMEIKRYGHGTLLFLRENKYEGGQALCSDGVVRRLSSLSPDHKTPFEIFGSIHVEGQDVVGSVIFETIDGELPNRHNPVVVKFSARGKYADRLPKGVYRAEQDES